MSPPFIGGAVPALLAAAMAALGLGARFVVVRSAGLRPLLLAALLFLFLVIGGWGIQRIVYALLS